MSELKNCPFCGSKAEEPVKTQARCSNKSCFASQWNTHDRLWNTRASTVEERWEPISTAPLKAASVRVKMKDGTIHEDAHYACDMSGSEQPGFKGWFIPRGETSFVGIDTPIGWQPLTAPRSAQGGEREKELAKRLLVEYHGAPLPEDFFKDYHASTMNILDLLDWVIRRMNLTPAPTDEDKDI